MIRYGILGCGRVAGRYLEVFRDELRGASVSAVCDLVSSRAQTMARALGAQVAPNLGALCHRSDVDVVCILTESGNHATHARAVLDAGKHVIVEKPAALVPQEILDLEHYARDRGLMYAVILQNRFNPAMRALKRAMEQGRFGKNVLGTVRVRWCRTQEYYEDGWHGTWKQDGGVICQQALHHLDALQWICGPVVEAVAAQSQALNRLEAEDTTVSLVRFASGALGAIEATTAARPSDFEASISVLGEKGSVVVGGIALNQIQAWEFVDRLPEDQEAIARYSQEVPTGYGLSHGPLMQEITDRLARKETTPPISGTEATHAVRLVHALYRSTESGGWVKADGALLSARLGKENKL